MKSINKIQNFFTVSTSDAEVGAADWGLWKGRGEGSKVEGVGNEWGGHQGWGSRVEGLRTAYQPLAPCCAALPPIFRRRESRRESAWGKPAPARRRRRRLSRPSGRRRRRHRRPAAWARRSRSVPTSARHPGPWTEKRVSAATFAPINFYFRF